MHRDERLRLLEDPKQENELLEQLIRRQALNGEPVYILEAGCGKCWPFKLDGIRYHLTGIDMDRAALEMRRNTLSDLHETIVGDLCSVDLAPDRYDVIYCSFVLEHVERADLVMKNFVKWAKPNALIIIRVPDPRSVQGYVTRITPHWFHVLFYRLVLGKKNAGKPGYCPYPTYYHPIISRRGMRDFCMDEKNSIVFEAEYGDGYIRPGQGIFRALIHVIKRTASIVSLGYLSCRHTNLVYILRKKCRQPD